MKKISVYKGNDLLDTTERAEAFDRKRGSGWETQYKEYRNNWSNYPNDMFVSKYPLEVDMELSTVCNLKCPMCSRRTEEYETNVEHKFMEFDLFKKVIDEVAGEVTAIRLSLTGESTLHPDFVACIKYAKDKGIREVSFLTHGGLLTEEYFEKVMLAGADWITLSIDGLDDVYESIRKPLKFADMFETVKMIKQLKQKHNTDKPVIKIQAVWPSIRNNPEEFYNKFVEHVDLIVFNPLIDLLGNDDESLISYEEDFMCPQHYQRIIVASNGDVLMCTADDLHTVVLGNAYKETIYSIWHGEKLSFIRALHKEKSGFKKIEVCKKCYRPRKIGGMEKANVNGREITIKNYENRAQKIGL